MGSYMLVMSSREDWGNFSWTAEVKVFLLTELKAFWRSRETRGLCSGQGVKCSGLCARRFSAPPRMPTPNWTGTKTPRGGGGELAFDVGHDGRAHYLMKKDSPYCDGGTDPIVLLSNRGDLAPKKKKGPEPLRDEVRVLCHSQAKQEQARSGPLG